MSDEQGRGYWLRRWAKALRETTAKQITGEANDGAGGMCARGVQFMDLVADGLFRMTPSGFPSAVAGPSWVHVNTLVNGDNNLILKVMRWNDIDGLSFTEIADRLDAEADRLERGDTIVLVAEGQREAPVFLG
jgi:hypothetical protein